MGAGVAGMICSMVTLPYVTRVLQPEYYGRVSYAQSVISYFSLLAELGILSYALRECAVVRGNKEKFQKLANQMFTINFSSACISLLLLQFVIWIVPGFHPYWLLIEIFAIGIIFDVLRVRWMYQAYEEYTYLALQGLASHILVLALVFIFIRADLDYVRYAWILITPSVIPGIMNIIRSRKFCQLKLEFSSELKTHMRPIMLIFASSVSHSIYVDSDTVLLGYMSGAYPVGLYTVAVRLYQTIKIVLSMALQVTIPRFCYFHNNGHKNEFGILLNKVINLMVIVCVPSLIGLAVLSEEIIRLLFGEAYLEAVLSLRLLSLAIVFAIPVLLLSNCVLIPMKKEKVVLRVTMIGAIVNVTLNLILIPFFAQNATAFTTLVSEFIVLLFYIKETKMEWYGRIDVKSLIQTVLAGIFMGALVGLIKIKIDNLIVITFLKVIIGVVTYFGMLLIMRNTIIWEYLHVFTAKVQKK